MWMIAIAVGAVMLLVGLLAKRMRFRKALIVVGALLLAAGLVYGGLTLILINGID